MSTGLYSVAKSILQIFTV